MNYSSRITTTTPTAMIVMIDQSGSMSEPINWNNTKITKAQALADVTNSLLWEIMLRTKGEDGYRHYFDIGVFGYSANDVYSLLPTSGGEWLLSPSRLFGAIQRTQTITRERTLPDSRVVINKINQRIWIDPRAEGRTPMYAAFQRAYHELMKWCKAHAQQDCFPPIVLNITDGEATDSTPEMLVEITDRIKELTTKDGKVILQNIHITNSSARSIMFPKSIDELPQDRNAKLLFEISSVMPEFYNRQIAQMLDEPKSNQDHRAMAYNASIEDLVRMIDIGTTSNI